MIALSPSSIWPWRRFGHNMFYQWLQQAENGTLSSYVSQWKVHLYEARYRLWFWVLKALLPQVRHTCQSSEFSFGNAHKIVKHHWKRSDIWSYGAVDWLVGFFNLTLHLIFWGEMRVHTRCNQLRFAHYIPTNIGLTVKYCCDW